MPEERRSDQRFTVNLPVKWDGMAGTHEARLEDISLGGCFINTTGRVEIDEVVSLEVRLPSGEWLGLRGEVASYQPGIGFGLLFSFLTEDEEDALKNLMSDML
jgi:hypothetical protein